MHNIDRTTNEMEFGFENEYNEGPFGNEYGHELGHEYGHEFGHEYGHELGHEYGHELGHEGEGPFHETMEMELATELLEVSNEAELEQFFGKLVRGAIGAASSFARSSAGKALGGILKNVAKKALPVLAGAAGGALLGPAGAAIGGKLGSFAANAFELELEGLSAEDREFEIARAFVRFAGDAAQNAARYGRGGDPNQIARNAYNYAAKRYAPGLLNGWGNQYPQRRGRIPRSGRWERRGNAIIIRLS
ncbi:MAG: hypothetical protein J7604_19365 [Sporocytophaga sp.]|uniref:hypothetical protein n=1 Tax=Sporocytophaga sp. TaxID=2231183 RepID=UPI001B1C754C|nr:hypothetical protein [Sporocytophaga sp.]MBO9702378.1 hypothetical protein [Sporocytophaga sp.]